MLVEMARDITFMLKTHNCTGSPQLTYDASVSAMVSCIADVNNWMTSNHLKLYIDKTNFILLETHQQSEKINLRNIHLNGFDVPVLGSISIFDYHDNRNGRWSDTIIDIDRL